MFGFQFGLPLIKSTTCPSLRVGSINPPTTMPLSINAFRSVWALLGSPVGPLFRSATPCVSPPIGISCWFPTFHPALSMVVTKSYPNRTPSSAPMKIHTSTVSGGDFARYARIFSFCCGDRWRDFTRSCSSSNERSALAALSCCFDIWVFARATSFSKPTTLEVAMAAVTPAASAELFARNAASAALLAEVFASPASLVRTAISWSAIVWRCLDDRKIPPSPSNSPATPIITSISPNFIHRLPCSAWYSIMSPTTKTAPNMRSAHSETSRMIKVADFDSEKSVPISASDLAGALGFALQGIGLAYLLYHRLHKRRKETLNRPNKA